MEDSPFVNAPEPVYMKKNLGGFSHLLTHIQPMPEIIRHIISTRKANLPSGRAGPGLPFRPGQR